MLAQVRGQPRHADPRRVHRNLRELGPRHAVELELAGLLVVLGGLEGRQIGVGETNLATSVCVRSRHRRSDDHSLADPASDVPR